jgi:hypothetical protein
MELGTQRERIHVICDCAETSLRYVPKGEDRPRFAIEAARRYADNPTHDVCNLSNEIYYPEDNGFHYSIVGTENSLQEINRAEILKFYKEHYTSPTLIIIGDVENDFQISNEISL